MLNGMATRYLMALLVYFAATAAVAQHLVAPGQVSLGGMLNVRAPRSEGGCPASFDGLVTGLLPVCFFVIEEK